MLEVLDKIGTTLIPTPVLGPYLVTTQVDLVYESVLADKTDIADFRVGAIVGTIPGYLDI